LRGFSLVAINVQDISDLRPSEYNPRTIKPKALAGLQNSMTELGDISGVVFNVRSGNLVGGHQRTKILGNLSRCEITKQPFTDETGTVSHGYLITSEGTRFNYREVDWDEIKERTANIEANNKHISGDWDISGLADVLSSLDGQVDFEAFNFDELIEDLDIDMKSFDGEEEENAEDRENEDKIPELEGEPIIKRGDLIELGEHRLLCGDSTSQEDVEKLMDGNVSELLFTSPPYSDMRDYSGNDLSIDTIIKFIPAFYDFAEYQIINLGIQRKDHEVVQYWDEYIKEAKDAGYKFLSWNIWNRENASSIGYQTAFFPIFHEWIFVFGKESKDINRTKKNKTPGSRGGTNRQKDGSSTKSSGITKEFGKMGTIFTAGVASGKLHPAMFPVELPEKHIEAMTNIGDIVTEPFTGSGTTLIACEKLNRKCYGMELSENYCDVIIQRYIDYTGNGRIKINGVDISWEQEAGIRKLEAEEMTNGGI
jgi:DNA modification methylase